MTRLHIRFIQLIHLLVSLSTGLTAMEAESFPVTLTVPNGSWSLEFHSAYQVNSTVAVVWQLKGTATGGGSVETHASVLIQGPAILADHHVVTDLAAGLQPSNPGVRFWNSLDGVPGISNGRLLATKEGNVLEQYDPADGNGWVTSAFGWLYVREYPWIWMNAAGEWAYVGLVFEDTGANAYAVHVRDRWNYLSERLYPDVYLYGEGWARSLVRDPSETRVTRIFSGVSLWESVLARPRPLSLKLLEINLADPGISFLVTPDNGDAPGENSLRTTRDFVDAVGAQAGVNASFFHFTNDSRPGVDNRGIVASQGNLYSPFENDSRPWPVLNISSDNNPRVLIRGSAGPGTDLLPSISPYNAVSGSEQIIRRDRNVAGSVEFGQPFELHPRTAAGYTLDGRLFLMTVDGRQSGFSEGMWTREVGDWLLDFGVYDAVNLDGGGSTTMVIADPEARTINSPSDGNDRSVAVSLAVFADSLERQPAFFVISDFAGGDRDGFTIAPVPHIRSQTVGVLRNSFGSPVKDPTALNRGWLYRLNILDDPLVAGTGQLPGNRWIVQQPYAGVGSSESYQWTMAGYVGFWTRTTTPGLQVSLTIRPQDGIQQGIPVDLAPDGRWQPCQWSLTDPAMWVDAPPYAQSGTFELDSLILSGPDADAVVDLDLILHSPDGPITEFPLATAE